MPTYADFLNRLMPSTPTSKRQRDRIALRAQVQYLCALANRLGIKVPFKHNKLRTKELSGAHSQLMAMNLEQAAKGI